MSDKAQYGQYKVGDKRQKNREAKLARHAKKHPNDSQGINAKEVKPFKVKPHTPGAFPALITRYHDPITGQFVDAPSFSTWDGLYDPIPTKRKGKKNAKTA